MFKFSWGVAILSESKNQILPSDDNFQIYAAAYTLFGGGGQQNPFSCWLTTWPG